VWHLTSPYVQGFLPGILCVATGLGLSFVPLTMTATSDEPEELQGLASGVFNTSQQVGAVGLAALAAIASAVTANGQRARDQPRGGTGVWVHDGGLRALISASAGGRGHRPNQVWRKCRVDARDHSPAAVLLGDRREMIVATTVTR
jgi:hypothetical protein